jgi:2-haloacid dehalogenase
MSPGPAPSGRHSASDPISALLFDVFGTLVDWRRGIAREVQAVLSPLGIALDGLAFADAWRAQYQPTMDQIRQGRCAFSTLDVLHGRNLDEVLKQFDLEQLAPRTRAQLTLAWHRLDAWPDVRAGLASLHPGFRLAPCSNGNISLMVDLARHNDLVWDAILGAEIARDYKPKPAVYLSSVAAFGCEPAQVMMVAAHSSDLAAAAAVGLRTAFVARPDEHGPGTGETRASIPVDFYAADLLDLAAQLRAVATTTARAGPSGS